MREKQKRTVLCGFSVTPEEDAIIERKMAAAGIKNKSAYLRAMILNGYLLRLDLHELRKAMELIRRLSSNVNQIAQRVNMKGTIYETEIDEIIQSEQEILDVMEQILDRLNRVSKES